MALSLYGPVTQLTGVGPKLQASLKKLKIHRVIDILFHLPMRYQNKAVITPIADLKAEQEAVVEGIIRHAHLRAGRQKVLTVTLDDNFTALNLVFFHFSDAQAKAFTSGKKIRAFGQIKPGLHGWQMMHPEYELGPTPLAANTHATLTAIYPSTAGITQKQWHDLQTQALDLLKLSGDTQRFTDADKRSNAETLLDTLHFIHQPDIQADVISLQQRQHPFIEDLAFEELLAHQLSLLHLRHHKQIYKAAPLQIDLQQQQQFIQQLGFELTQAQQRVLDEIFSDFKKPQPMLRLIQGDVGSGKTVVAALAALAAISSGFQVAILAPTEILAEQHLLSFQQWFKPLNISVDWLVSRHKKQHKDAVLNQLKQRNKDSLKLLIGTHAIFQDDVAFNKLGLVIIDEQHRFGVHQRLALRDKGLHIDDNIHNTGPLSYTAPHQLVMTATPIPRTLAMCAYADLDCSVIDELPAGRKTIQTVVMEQHRRAEVVERILTLCQQGQQVYWVNTLIHESENMDCQSAAETAAFLQQALPQLNIGLVHGQLNSEQKTATMQAFSSGKLDVLVATTVIEVGVNIPNATLMVIENPERLGLAQLHQLRGRVGRGHQQSFCLLLYQKPLTDNGKARLKVLRESSDGFVIAEKDLQLRGPGELLGSQQSGITRFKVADLQLHGHLLEAVDKTAHALMQDSQKNQVLIEMLSQRWIEAADDYVQA
ncbi:MAG: ATP-dependent DNA helicase RecG [Pseudomonadales bacterium]|nr:ATP-dependent DNA helicase RecG [Pseudomonadales bacterium]